MSKKRFKGKISTDYDLLLLAAPHYIACQRKLGKILKKHFAGQKAGKFNVLEMGCGNGFTTEIILKADKRIRLIAVDNEPEMIKQAKKRLAKFIKKKQVKIIKADALGYVKKSSSNRFDAFASALTIHNFNFRYRRKFIEEIYRLLKIGGIFVNMDRYAQDDSKIFKKGLDWQIGMYHKVFSKLGKNDLLEKWLEHEEHDARPDIIMKEKSAVADIKKAGFKNIRFVFRKRTYAILTAKK